MKNTHQFAGHLQSVLEKERTRISREIHDELGQLLCVLQIDLNWLEKRLPGENQSLVNKIKTMSKLVDTMSDSVIRIAKGLRPSMLDEFGLVSAIKWQAAEFEKRTGINCEFKNYTNNLNNFLEDNDHEVSINLFRILQETLTNIMRHAKATNVKVRLEQKNGDIFFEIKDNGIGIDENKNKATSSLGLIGIQERTHLLNGKVKVSTVNNKGTTVLITIPSNSKRVDVIQKNNKAIKFGYRKQ